MNYQPIMEIEKANIFPLFLIQESATNDLKEVLGKAFKEMVGIFREGTGSFYWLEDDAAEVCGWAVKRVEDEPVFVKEVEKKMIELCQKLDKFGENLGKTNLNSLTEEELIKLYKQYCAIQNRLRAYGWVPNLLDFGRETIFEKVEKRLLGELKDKGNLGAYLSLLTTPVKETINRKQEKELLKILIAIKKKGLENWQDDKETNKQIDRYMKKYGWLTYYYNGPALDRKETLAIVRESLKTIKEPEKKLEEINNYRSTVNQKKNELLQKIKLSKKSLYLTKAIELMMFLKIYRKEFLIKSHFLMEPLMKELGRRFNLSLTEARTLLPEDFEKKLDLKQLAQKRFAFCVYVARPGKSEILVGEEAEKFIKKIGTKKEETKKEIKGRCAFPGTVVGTVKIINIKEDMAKMKEGDILVSRATNPDLVVAMQKAAAIVTETGGITSHAAIVSREMQKPCIVGTNIATKVLKDGDLVEVDATNGVVKKL